MKRSTKTAWLAMAMAFVMAASPAADEVLPAVLKKAEQLLRDGHPRQALALLSPLETREAGNPHFDYLLGASELVSGHPDRASLALERAVAVEPRHAAARVDLARAYYLLGDFPRARAEFEVAAQLDPPPAARKTIANYLAAISAREAGPSYRIAAYAEAAVGRDTNINNATSRSQVAIPALDDLIVTLNPSNVRMADNFHSLTAGAGIDMPLGAGFSAFAAGSLNRRDNFRSNRFDTAATDVRTGIEYAHDGRVLQLSLLGGRMYLDRRLNRTVAGGAGEWKQALDPETQIQLALQYLRYRFPAPELAANGFNQWTGAFGASRAILDGKAAISASLLWGREHEARGRADGSKTIGGLQLAGRWLWDEQTDFHVSLGWVDGRYDGINPAFQRKRRDRDMRATIGMTRKFGDHYSLRPEIGFLRNRSNLPVFDFREAVFAVKARYEFER
jgi:tetratricopeptide (TPR) repeat protein